MVGERALDVGHLEREAGRRGTPVGTHRDRPGGDPFRALDDKAIAVLQRLLREGLESGKTIVMSTHQLREALELASHVALLVRGKVAFHGPCLPEMVSDPGWVYARYGEG